MDVVYERCAGLDVHKKTVTACRIYPDAQGHKTKDIRTFTTMTQDLLKLADWLAQAGCTHAGMESTGDYWKPVFNILEAGFKVLLINAQHIKNVPGRKTDVGDAEWIADLLQHGLLRASFIPPQAQRDLRDLTRYRMNLVQERSMVVQWLQKVLESANIKLAAVATDVLGVSGRAMLQALVEGSPDAAAMADLAKGRMREKRAALEQALTGRVRPHHRVLIADHLIHIDFLDERIDFITQQITKHIDEHFPNDEEALRLLDTIPGVGRNTAEMLLAEIGPDMSRFPSANRLASWAGLAPGNNESAGKKRSARTRRGNRNLRTGLLQAAHAAVRKGKSYLAAQYHRLATRRGKKKAAVAVAHSILVSAYYILSRREPYHDLGPAYFDELKREATVRRLTQRIQNLGYLVIVRPTPATADV